MSKIKKISSTAAILLFLAAQNTSFAAQPPGITTAPYTVSYSARLTDALGVVVTTTQSIRFSIWINSDFDATDLLGSGAIDPVAGGFTGWQETHTVTPDANGLFHVRLGETMTLPNFTSDVDKYLEVDVKPVADPDTSFEVLDPDGSTANVDDRHLINSAPFTINADTVDNADVGTSTGDLVVLDAFNLFPISTIPGGTNAENFILDADDTVPLVGPGVIELQFGTTLSKILSYDPVAGWFNFNDDVNIMGNLTLAGSADFSTATEFHIREVPDEATATCTTVNELVVDTTESRIYVCTAVGAPGTWKAVDSTVYSQSLAYEAEYEDGVIARDGSNNTGKLESFFVDTDGAPGNNNINYYHWTTDVAGTNDMDLVIRAKLPEGFVSWQATPVQFTYRTGTALAANNQLDVSIEDTAGTAIALTGASALTSTTFATAPITFGGVPTFTAGQPITIHIKMTATTLGSADAGLLQLNYNGI